MRPYARIAASAGILTFAAPDPAPQTVTLKIRGVAVPERVFTWKP